MNHRVGTIGCDDPRGQGGSTREI
jgi:hypothetical protein